jgi:hypothetical protein
MLGADGTGSFEDGAEAVNYAVKMGADIINFSLAGTSSNESIAKAVQRAYEAGVINVAAVGNEGDDLDETPYYPACLRSEAADWVIGVTATDNDDKETDFTNYGRSCADVAAPGAEFYSLSRSAAGEQYSKGELVNSYYLTDRISRKLNQKDVVVCDAGTPFYVVAQSIFIARGVRYITPGSMGTMGYNLPASIGASVAGGQGRVVCITGDGSFQMNIQELQKLFKSTTVRNTGIILLSVGLFFFSKYSIHCAMEKVCDSVIVDRLVRHDVTLLHRRAHRNPGNLLLLKLEKDHCCRV